MRPLLIGSLAMLFAIAVAFQAKAQSAGGTYYDLGVFAYEEGNFKEAEAHFTKALEAEPGEASYNHYLGKTLSAQERFREAETYFNMAWEKDPSLPGLAYDRAYVHFKLGEYEKGANLFREVVNADPEHILANFYGGVCLYRTGRYPEAAAYLTSVAEKSPELRVESYYYSGLCHYHMGQEQAAIQKLTFVQAHSDSSEVRTNAGKWLNRIKEGKPVAKRYTLDAKLAFAYDDNVPLEPTNQDDLFSDEQDTVILGYVAGTFNFVNQHNFELGIGASRAQSWYTDLDAYNTSETAGQVYAYYFSDPFSWGMKIRPLLYQVDAEDFLLLVQVSPSVSYQVSKTTSARLTYTYESNDYRQDDYDGRDGNYQDGFLDAVYNLNNNRGYVQGGIGYGVNAADEKEFDYGKFKARISASIELTKNLRLGLLGGYFNKSYKNEDPLADEKRADTQFELAVSLSRVLWIDWLRLALEYNYTQNNSNIEDFEYTRQVAGIAMIADW